MDQGVAAVIGAAVGAAGAAGAATLAWRLTRSRTQLRIEEVRWRRQVRRDAYLEALTAARSVLADLLAALDLMALAPAPSRATMGRRVLREVVEQLPALETATQRVGLEGPDDVAGAAHRMQERVTALVTLAYPRQGMDPAGDPRSMAAFRRCREDAESAVAEFTRRARDALGGERVAP